MQKYACFYEKGNICIYLFLCNCFYMHIGTYSKLVYQCREEDFTPWFPNFDCLTI